MKSRLALLLLGLGLAISGCDPTETADLHGSFSGTFTAYELDGDVEKSGPVTVTFDGNTYSSTSNSDRYPAGGSGTYRFLDDAMIRFEDKNRWTADFNWTLILNGDYGYKFSGDSLSLTRYSGAARIYEYKLKRNE